MLKKLTAQVFSSNKLKTALTLSAILVSTAILGYLIYSQKDVLLAYDWNINWVLLAPIFVLYTINLFLVSQVWALILRALGINASLFVHVRNYSIANLMKRLPGTIWYVAWRTQSYNTDLGASPKLVSLASGIELAVFGIATVLISLVFSIKTIVEELIKNLGVIRNPLRLLIFIYTRGSKKVLFLGRRIEPKDKNH